MSSWNRDHVRILSSSRILPWFINSDGRLKTFVPWLKVPTGNPERSKHGPRQNKSQNKQHDAQQTSRCQKHAPTRGSSKDTQWPVLSETEGLGMFQVPELVSGCSPAEPHWSLECRGGIGGPGYRIQTLRDHCHVGSHQGRVFDDRLHQVDLDADCRMFTPFIPPHCRRHSPRLSGVNLQVGDPLMTPAEHASASVARVGERTQLQNVWRVRWEGFEGLGSRDVEDLEVQGFHGGEEFDQMPDLKVGAASFEV